MAISERPGYVACDIPCGARIGEEHGWLCVRTDGGFLLWAMELKHMPAKGIYLSGMLAGLNADRPLNPSTTAAVIQQGEKK